MLHANKILEQALAFKAEMDESMLWDANTPDGLVPDFWTDDSGVRHIIVREEGPPDRMRLKKIGDKWELIEEAPF